MIVPDEATPRIGRYLVEAKLAEGGMAESWLCRLVGERGFSKRVVVKTLRQAQQTDEFYTMFADEANIGAVLDHPHVAKVLEFGNGPTGPFMVQEYIEGPSVAQIMSRLTAVISPDLRFAVRIVSSIASALDHAFNVPDDEGRPRRVIHRDVSPSNIIVSRRGVPKLIDFGVAVFEGRETKTQVGVLKGKLRYMAPEALLHGIVSHQGDVYSLGIVLFCLCCGESPWRMTDHESIDAMRQPIRVKPHVDRELAAIIERCLQPDRHQRFASAKELQLALEQWLHHHGGAVEDAEVAARLRELFPEGPTAWRSANWPIDASALSSASVSSVSLAMRSATPLAAPHRATSSLPWAWLLVVAMALFIPSVGAFFTAMVAVWLALMEVRSESNVPPPLPVAVEEVRTPEEEAAARVAAELELLERGQAIEKSAETDPVAALEQARKLHELHPAPEFAALVERLERKVQEATAPAPVPSPAPAPVAPATPKPRVVPAPAPAPTGDVLGRRIRRPPSEEPAPEGTP